MPTVKRSSALCLLASTFTLASCAPTRQGSATAVSSATLRDNVKTIVVVYAENRSFDNLFGKFPGANGIATVLTPAPCAELVIPIVSIVSFAGAAMLAA